MGKGDEDEHGLGEDLVPLVLRHVFDGAAVVEAVGEFDENNPHIVIHGEEDALEILCLEALLGDIGAAGLLLRIKDVLNLGKAVHKGGNLVPESFPQVFHGIVGVFDDVVQKGGRDGLVAKSYLVHDYLGNGNGMYHVGLPTAPSHVPVSVICKLVCTPHHLKFLFGCTPFPCCFLEDGPIGLDYLIVFFCELRKTHSVFMVFCILSLRLRITSSFMWSMSSEVTLCLSTFWKA